MTCQLIDLKAGCVNLNFVFGDSFTKLITFTNFDLTGYTIEAEIITPDATFAFTISEQTSSSVRITMPTAMSATIPLSARIYVWELNIVNGGVRRTILKGRVQNAY